MKPIVAENTVQSSPKEHFDSAIITFTSHHEDNRPPEMIEKLSERPFMRIKGEKHKKIKEITYLPNAVV